MSETMAVTAEEMATSTDEQLRAIHEVAEIADTLESLSDELHTSH